MADLPIDIDEDIVSKSGSKDDILFDNIIGCLQSIVLDAEFTDMQRQFLQQHCDEFIDVEENKLSYMTIFKQYTATIETFLTNRLAKEVNGFSMDVFAKLLNKRHDYIDPNLLDLLESFADFASFKSMMLDTKKSKTQDMSADAFGLCVTSLKRC